jgi:ribosome-associated protein
LPLASKELAEQAANSMLEIGALDVRIFDLRNITSIVDYFVIGSANSVPHIKAVVDEVNDQLETMDTQVWHTEGKQGWRWVLLDYVDVVVHVFQEETREFYGLERLWGDAPVTQVYVDSETGETLQKVISTSVSKVVETLE